MPEAFYDLKSKFSLCKREFYDLRYNEISVYLLTGYEDHQTIISE